MGGWFGRTLSVFAIAALISSNCAHGERAALQSLTVTAPNTSLLDGQTEQLTATGTFSDGSTQTMNSSVAWTSSNTGGATIGTSGLLTAIAAGSSNVNAASSGITSNLLALAVVTAIQHSVDVSWTASTSTVAGYNVYRGTQTGVRIRS